MALLRLWLSEHSVIPVLAIAFLVLALGYGVAFFPLGPAEHVVGTVQRITLGPGKNAWNRVAYVMLGDQTVAVSVAPTACAVGESILLERQRRLWGYSVIADPAGCAFSAAPGPAGR